MVVSQKPILYNGYFVREEISIVKRIERKYFTEVYLLSNGKYFLLFSNIQFDQVVAKSKEFDLLTVSVGDQKFLGAITEQHSNAAIASIIDDLTVLRGFDCVAGMKQLKAMLINDVINPLRTPEKYKRFKLNVPNGILLYGPPGCGKTFIVKKLAEELGYNYVEMNPSSVATPYVHGAVGNISKVFETAKLQAPSVIFIDEIEGLVPKREELGSHADIKKEEINEFLLQLNNAGDSRILVVGATNRPHMIDTAILRSGRMDKRVYVPPPDWEARKDLFRICLTGRPYERNIDFDKLANMTENYVGSDIELLVTEAARIAVSTDRNSIDESMIVAAIEKFSPSVSIEDIALFDKFSGMQRS
jgi:transitional endoplasmic reticulum ATPase